MARKAETEASGPSGIGHETKTNSPDLSNGKIETPVPLPSYSSEALATKTGPPINPRPPGSNLAALDSPYLKNRIPDATTTRPLSTPVTPVPLPMPVRQSLSFSEVNGSQRESSIASNSKHGIKSFDSTRTSSPAPTKNKQIHIALDGTPYLVFVDATGLHTPTRGALIPAKYKLSENPDFPFICPIRDCRRTLPNLHGLAGHFGGAHRYAQVNDNQDGTFTQVGTYKNASGSSPCIVVSQNPLPANAPPPVEPRLPDMIANAISSQAKRQACDQGGARTKRQNTSAPYSTQTCTNWNGGLQDHVPGNVGNSWQHVNIAPNHSSLDQSNFSSSAPAHLSRPLPSSTAFTATPLSNGSTAPPSSSALSPQNAPEHILPGRRSVRQSVLARLQADKDVSGSQSSTRSPIAQQDTAATGLSNQTEEADYEMEGWEIAPGRVTSQDSRQNLAYSGAFLASSTPIVMCSDTWFNVLTIRPGQIYHVPIQRDKVQMYSVASGKVKITTIGQIVQLGPNSAFPLRPGQQCVIENRLYSEATLHCTTVKDYEII